jgi:hypothetical protein
VAYIYGGAGSNLHIYPTQGPGGYQAPKNVAPKTKAPQTVPDVLNPSRQIGAYSVQPKLGPLGASSPYANYAAGVVNPGSANNYANAPTIKYPSKSPSKTAVARRVVSKGPARPAGPVSPAVDPLEALRGEYDKYLQDIYGGLTTSLQGERTDYQNRSNDLAARLKAIYDASDATANSANTSAQQAMTDYATRMGLQSAAPTAMAPWQQQNAQIIAQNAANRANSTATNDLIRTNYYDFLGDKISSAQGAEATARGGLNDIIAQAIVARQQAAAAAARAAAARRSSGKKGGGSSGSGPITTTTTDTTSSSNNDLFGLANQYSDVMDQIIANNPIASGILKKGTTPIASPAYGVPGSPESAAMHAAYNTLNTNKQTAEALAKAYIIKAGATGGPKTASKVTSTSKSKVK